MTRFAERCVAFLRRLAGIATLTILAACQAQTASPTAPVTVPPIPTDISKTSLSPLFDGFKMVDAQSGWAWKGVSQLYRTDDGGTTWNEIHLFGRMLAAGGFYLDRNEAWLPGVPDANIMQGVFHTADGGKAWTKLAELHGPNIDLYFHDAKVGWATNGIGAAGNIFYQVYQTLDGGQTWTQLQPNARGGEQAGPVANAVRVASGDSLSFQPPNTIWITSGVGLSTPYAGLTVSRDGGQTWKDINLLLSGDLLKGQPAVAAQAPQFVSANQAYLPVTVGNRLVFFASQDAGDSWQLLPAVLPAGQMQPRVQFVSRSDGFAVCGLSLCSTQDGGRSWMQISTPFSFAVSPAGASVSQFQFVDASTGWAILSDPGGNTAFLKTTNGGRTWVNQQPRLGF